MLGEGSSVFLRAVFYLVRFFFSRSQVIQTLKTSAVRSILQRRQLCWAPEASLGSVWAVSYRSGPQCILIMRQGRGSEATDAVFLPLGKKASSYRGVYRVPSFN